MKIWNTWFQKIQKTSGFTLVEVIISLAILGVITVSIITIFSSSFTNIFSLGNKSQALAEASRKVEVLYTIPVGERSIDTLRAALEDEDTHYVEETGLYQETSEDITRFTIEPKTLLQGYGEENTGFEVTIVVFYRDGQRRVTLNTFLRGGN